MQKNVNDNFYELKKIANDRLDPGHIAAWFLATNMVSAILFIPLGLDLKGIPKIIYTITLIAHTLVTLFYKDIRRSYKYQNIQSVLLVFIATKMPLEMYMFLITNREANGVSETMVRVGILFLISGIIATFVYTIRAIGKVKDGCFNEDGDGLYNFKSSKNYTVFSIIFPVVMLTTGLIRILSSYEMQNINMIILLIIVFILHFSMAMALPEMYLLMYCKLKYDDFRVAMPSRFKKRYKKADVENL